jgi:hypothetical protein
LLIHDPEFLQQRDRQHFEGHLERGKGRVCLWDLKGLLPQVETLKFLNLTRWFDPQRELSSHDPDLIEWANVLKRFASDLRDLGLGSFDEKLSPIQVLSIMLSNLGMKLEKTSRHRIEGVKNAVQFYRYCCPGDGRAEVFQVWSQRDLEAIAARAAALPNEGIEAVFHPDGCVTPEYIEVNTVDTHTRWVTQSKPKALQTRDKSLKPGGVALTTTSESGERNKARGYFP